MTTVADVLGPQEQLVENVVATYLVADPASDAWYLHANELASTMAPAAEAAGVIAALSPMVSWSNNERLARYALLHGRAIGHFPANCAKANRIMYGEHPLSVLGGHKVRAFYRCILDPENPEPVLAPR